MAWLDDHDYALTIDVNMGVWARKMSEAPSIAVVNPTFDPKFSPLSPENSFWLDVRAGSRTVAMMAGRLFITDDYLEVKRTMKLWYDPPRPCDRPIAMELPIGTPLIAGKVAHEGGLWVHPNYRKQGLSVILPHLTRALCLRQWNIDWITGATMRGIGESGMAVRAYGMRHVVPCYEGHFSVTQRPDRLFLAYMNRDELLAGLELDSVARLLPNGNHQMGHPILVLAQEG